ncbi:MAG: hypothetical protein KGS72_07305 [Cyanobacteria bacterium REEB67]|nr:hypothetical protein [Cyanobacteria bacterium REEB67]
MSRLLKSLLVVPLLLTFFSTGLIVPAHAESAPRQNFYQYIRTLYYATNVKQVSKFFIKNARVPMEDCIGGAAKAKLEELKRGYVADPRITTEVLNGNICTMKGTGIALADGHRVNATINVIMNFEEGSWKIQYYTWQGAIPGHY